MAALQGGFESRWNDFLPSTGKRSGAYSTGVYGVHPYQLLNFNGKYDDVSTLAHESGHSMHTLLASRAQPYPTSDYAIFVAEVASTLNENLLLQHQLLGGDQGRRRPASSCSGAASTSLRATLFRQTMFAEFELAIHELAEKGEALTGENLSARLPGVGAQVLRPRRRASARSTTSYGDEWTYIPHFYYDFYVYQYATSLVASTSIAKAIREDEAKRAHRRRATRYLAMLKRGRVEVPGGPAAGGRGGHDHLRALRRGHGGDERHHGRDGGDPGAPEAVGAGVSTVRSPRRPAATATL